jgi:hypothetical protein
MPFDSLVLKSDARRQTAFIKSLRRERADRRMQTPRSLQKQTSIRLDRFRAAQQMFERRRLGSLGMTSPQRLFQLPGIAKKHNVSRRIRYRQHVGERYLPGFVYEQNVYSLEELV